MRRLSLDFLGPAHFGEQRLSTECRGATQEHHQRLWRVLPHWVPRCCVELGEARHRNA